MIVDPIRLLIAWLTDAGTGLNAQLAHVPRPAGEPAPPAVQIYNELDHPWVARNLINRDALREAPGLIIRFPELEPEAVVRMPALPEHLEGGGVLVPVVAQYARRKLVGQGIPANSAALVRDARQTMRTFVRVISQHFPNAHTVYGAELYPENQCVIGLAPSGCQIENRYVDYGDDEVLDAALVPFLVLDRWALGIT